MIAGGWWVELRLWPQDIEVGHRQVVQQVNGMQRLLPSGRPRALREVKVCPYTPGSILS